MMHVALEKPDTAKLRIRTGNSLQHASGEFGEFLTSLGMRRGFIWKNTTEQNGRIELFHKTFAKECDAL